MFVEVIMSLWVLYEIKRYQYYKRTYAYKCACMILQFHFVLSNIFCSFVVFHVFMSLCCHYVAWNCMLLFNISLATLWYFNTFALPCIWVVFACSAANLTRRAHLSHMCRSLIVFCLIVSLHNMILHVLFDAIFLTMSCKLVASYIAINALNAVWSPRASAAP